MDPLTMIIGALAGAGTAGSGYLLDELINRKDLKAQRKEFRDTRRKVEEGRFGPNALALASREAKMKGDLRSAQEIGRNEFERQAAALGSAGGADLQRARARQSRSYAAASLAGSQQLADQARAERDLDELTTKQSLEDMRAARRAKSAAIIGGLMKGATMGAGVAGQQAAYREMNPRRSAAGLDDATQRDSSLPGAEDAARINDAITAAEGGVGQFAEVLDQMSRLSPEEQQQLLALLARLR